jgi:hypothetical protein
MSDAALPRLEQAVAHLLRTIPETWAEYDSSALSEFQERAVKLLTAAGMIERRITFRLRMAGHPAMIEATITVTGEAGLAQAMEFVLKDIWSEWRAAFEQHDTSPGFHCERLGNEQWRLTTEGVTARNDLDAGNAAIVFDFVLRRGFFDGRPRLLLDGRITQRLPVAGRGVLERIQRASSAAPANVAIANWDAGANAFAKAFAELLKAKQAAEEPAVAEAYAALLRVFTNGIADERLQRAAQILTDDALTVNEKLSKIDALIPFPPTASAEQLAQMLHVTKQSVLKSSWWIQNRKGERESEIGRRREWHRRRAEGYEAPARDDER